MACERRRRSRREGEREGRGGGGRDVGKEIYVRRDGCKIRGEDQFKFAVRLGFIIDDAVNDITPGKLRSYSGG